MAEEEVISKKPIGLAETILVLMIVGVEELFEVFILVITLGAGIIITEIMNGAMAMLLEMYMLLRGGSGVMKMIVTPVFAAVDAATGGLLPGKLIGAALGIWIINHPEKMGKWTQAVAGITSRATQAVMGGIGGGIVVAGARLAGASPAIPAPEKTDTIVRQRLATGKAPTKMVTQEKADAVNMQKRDISDITAKKAA